MYRDVFFDTEVKMDSTTIDGEDYHRVVARVAKLGIVNRNKRRLHKDIVGEGNKVGVFVSDWLHSSLPETKNGVVVRTPTSSPATVGMVIESGEYLVGDSLYRKSDPYAMHAYNTLMDYININGDVAYSLGYDGGVVRNGVVECYRDNTRLLEFSPVPLGFAGSDDTGVLHMDFASELDDEKPEDAVVDEEGQEPSTPALQEKPEPEKVEILTLEGASVEQLIETLNAKGNGVYADITPYIEQMKRRNALIRI